MRKVEGLNGGSSLPSSELPRSFLVSASWRDEKEGEYL